MAKKSLAQIALKEFLTDRDDLAIGQKATLIVGDKKIEAEIVMRSSEYDRETQRGKMYKIYCTYKAVGTGETYIMECGEIEVYNT